MSPPAPPVLTKATVETGQPVVMESASTFSLSLLEVLALEHTNAKLVWFVDPLEHVLPMPPMKQ